MRGSCLVLDLLPGLQDLSRQHRQQPRETDRQLVLACRRNLNQSASSAITTVSSADHTCVRDVHCIRSQIRIVIPGILVVTLSPHSETDGRERRKPPNTAYEL